MKTTRWMIFFAVFVLLSVQTVAQDKPAQRPVQMNISVGIGSVNLTETYLSPYKYVGVCPAIMGERLRYFRGNDRLLGMQTLGVDFSQSTYGSEWGSNYGLRVDYAYGVLYNLYREGALSVSVGGSTSLLAGVLYNDRNSNNPANAKAAVNLNLTALASYRLVLGSYPLTFRYTLSTPVVGAFFTPEYGQSYYEMFIIGNHSGMIHFASPHNQLAIRNQLSVDLPVGNGAIRVGFLNDAGRTLAHDLISYRMVNSIVLGYTVEFSINPLKKRSIHHPTSF